MRLARLAWAALSLAALVGAPQAQACGFTQAGGVPVLADGGREALQPILGLALAGSRPFVLFTSGQPDGRLDEFLDRALDWHAVVVNPTALEPGPEIDGYMKGRDDGERGRPAAYLFHGRAGSGHEGAGLKWRFHAPEAVTMRLRGALSGASARLKLDGKELPLMPRAVGQGSCLDSMVALGRGEHTLEAVGAESAAAAFMDAAPEAAGTPPPELAFTKVNPTRHVISVKGSEGPFTLVFSESYGEGWKAFVRKEPQEQEARLALVAAWRERGLRHEAGPHLVVNGYANGWLVDWPGRQDFQMVVEYTPHRRVEAGLAVSAMAFAGSGLALALRRIVRRKGLS